MLHLRIILLNLVLMFGEPGLQGQLERLPTVLDARLKELSGLVASRKYAGVFWAHGDSGNPAAVFALDRGGVTLGRFMVRAPNVDWEDIATDNDGHLYVGDIGNNLKILPVRIIHELEEPDPNRKDEAPLKPIRSFAYRFPQAGVFDAEALFVDGDDLVLIEKWSDRRPPRIWSLSRKDPRGLSNPADLRARGTLPGFPEPVTGASLSTDGRWLAVCSTGVVRVYGRSASGGWDLKRSQDLPAGEGYEAVSWDGGDVVIASESGRWDRWIGPVADQERGGRR